MPEWKFIFPDLDSSKDKSRRLHKDWEIRRPRRSTWTQRTTDEAEILNTGYGKDEAISINQSMIEPDLTLINAFRTV